jgi:hypothetical protein
VFHIKNFYFHFYLFLIIFSDEIFELLLQKAKDKKKLRK